MPGPSNLTIRTFQATDTEALTSLLRESLASGEQAGHSSSDFESLIGAFPIVRHLLVAELDGAPVGLISHDHRVVVVEPASRRRGIGRTLVEASEAELSSSPDGPLVLFPPHGNVGATAFLETLGFQYDHSFWRLELDAGHHDQLPMLPDDVELAPYSEDEIMPYIDLINATFADHPTPLRVTLEQIEHVHAHSSFDPAAIALLRDRSGRLVAFCITGVDEENGSRVGKIELVGVLTDYRGRGLGLFLLLWGIDRLRSIGIETIELNVDGENENALGLYRSVGFEAVEEWPQWMRAT